MVWGSRAWSIYIYIYIYMDLYIYLGICIYIYVGIQVYSWCEYCWIWARAHSGAHSSARHPHRHTHRHSQHDGRHLHRDIMRHTRVVERSLDLDACMHDTRHRGRSHESRDIDAIGLWRPRAEILRRNEQGTSKSDAEFAPMSFSDGRMYMSSSWNGGSENTCIMRVPTVRK